VPGANAVLTKLCNEWARKEKVDLKVDYILKLGLATNSEAQLQAGHDVVSFANWFGGIPGIAENLEPVDDIMAELIRQNGSVASVFEYLGRQRGHWIAVPATAGSQLKVPCARIDLFKQHVGLDLTQMYPPNAPPDKTLSQNWTWDTFRTAAERCYRAGYPFGLGLSPTTDSVDWVGALFASYGAQLVDAEGNVTVRSDATRQVLEYMKQLAPFLPPDAVTWDDSSNNKWLIAGKGALIINPPSAWAAAKQNNPKVAEQLWTFPTPKGPKGRFQAIEPFFWGIWKFSSNKSAAKSLLMHLSERAAVRELVAGSSGYDIPGFSGLNDLDVWGDQGPPKGTLYHYPPAADQTIWMSGSPAPPRIAYQIYVQGTITKMVAKYASGESIDKTLAWAVSELEGFVALAGLTAPARPVAQRAANVRRVGYLTPFSLPFEGDGIHIFEQTLRERGYVQGQTISMTYRSSAGRDEQLPSLASQLVALNVDVIVAYGTVATQAAQKATRTVPVVMISAFDPVQSGFVASFSNPGGNITGSSDLSEELIAKRLDLLKHLIPPTGLIAVLWDTTNPANALEIKRTEAVALTLGLRVRAVGVQNRGEIDKAFADMRRWRPQALVVLSSSLAIVQLVQTLKLATDAHLPTMYSTRRATVAGALLSYGPDLAEQYTQAAAFVDKILKGAKPAELPVEQPTRFELVVNLATAKALGVTIPESLLVSANELIRADSYCAGSCNP
jgi:ABC-type uncharacterized transport system substrate-binding protein